MSQVLEEVPEHLAPAARAALDAINAERGADFRLTGLVDPGPFEGAAPPELSLVLCDGEMCAREAVRITPSGTGFSVSLLAERDPLIPPHLDPPAGVRESWLASQLARHAFVVILFYRGFW